MNVIWIAVAAVSLPGLVFGAILGHVSRCFAVEDDPVVGKTDGILPQNQYGQCDYPGCRSYAEAISCSGGGVNRCAPDGEAVMLGIAKLFNVKSQPSDGRAQELTPVQMVAVIDENNCIGCTKCTQACPVDIIAGATRAMYTVMSDLCTNCNLYVDLCPTHCISLRPVAETPDPWRWDLNTIPVCIIPVEHHA